MTHDLQPAVSARLALLGTGLLVLLCLWLMLRIVWLISSGPTIDPAPVPPIPRMTQSTSPNGEFRWQLFGQAQRLATPVQQVTAVSRTRLRLMGVVSGENGYAMISDSSNGERVYRVDDELPDGSRLAAIESNQVILSVNGQNEILALDQDQARATSLPSRQQATRVNPNARSTPNPMVGNMPGFRRVPAQTSVSIASLPDMARASGFDLSGMANSISIMPVNGGGFRVRPGRNAQLFSQLGLQVNDVVTAINGQALQSEAQIQGLFADVLTRGEVAITVNRQGREVVLRPDIEQIVRSLQNP
ncbi:MAG: type II secretion system protein N [Pseudomonadota bacterium]